jgi:6-phosphofructokinase 1
MGSTLGEVGLLEEAARRGSAHAVGDAVLLTLPRTALVNTAFPSKLLSSLLLFFGKRFSSLISGADFYREFDVLLLQDGGCSPGYDSVTAFLTEFFEKQERQVYIARQGFKSIVSGEDEDFCSLVHSQPLYAQINLVPRVIYAPELRDRRGAMFRTERYPQFKEAALQQEAAKHIIARNVKTLVTIGGNGTFMGTRELCKYLPPFIKVYFIPVTIDSDVSGTECIGQHTAVEVGAEQVHSFIADSMTHDRCYIVEMMGAEGGYHALFSAIGAGAELAVMPNSQLDLNLVAHAVQQRRHTVIVVAEGYKRHERMAQKSNLNAAQWLYNELLATGKLSKDRKVVCEPFTRAARGCAPRNLDIALSQLMARQTTYLDRDGKSHLMPTVNSHKAGALPFDLICTNNAVDSSLVTLADHIGAHMGRGGEKMGGE